MPRLRFTPAKAQAQAPVVSPGKQAQAAAAPNVMQWLQYEVGPSEAVRRLGQVVGKGAELMFDAYIDDLNRKDRERQQEEADIIDSLAGQIKRFAQTERVALFKDIDDRKISSKEFAEKLRKRITDKRKSLLNNEIVQAYLKDNPNRKEAFLRRATIQVDNAGFSDTEQTILQKLTSEQSQQNQAYEQALRAAKLEFAERAVEEGLLYKEEYTPESSRSEIRESLYSIQSDVLNKYQNELPEQYHQRLENDVTGLFINQSGRLQTWAVHKTLGEEGRTKTRIVNLAKREARLLLGKKLNDSKIQQRLLSSDPDEADQANRELFQELGSIVTTIAADKRFAGKLEELDKQEISTNLRELFQDGEYSAKAEAVNRLLKERDEIERDQEQLKLRDERSRIGQAEIDFSDSTQKIIQDYNAANIDLDEAKSRIAAAAESARQKNQLEIAPDATELSAEDLQFNKELKQRTDTLRTSLQTRLSGVEGSREKALDESTKAELKRIRQKAEQDSISRAATTYRERLIEFNTEMQKNRGNKKYDLEYIQQKQLEILDGVLTDEYGTGDRQFEKVAARNKAFEALKAIQVARTEQLQHAITADSINLEAGGKMSQYMEEINEQRDLLREQVEKGEITNPMLAAEQFESFVKQRRNDYIQEAKDSEMPAVAFDFETAPEFGSKVPAMIAGFTQEMTVKNEKIIRDSDTARINKIIDLPQDYGELENISPHYRTYKDEEDVISGESEGDPRLMGIAQILAPKIGSIYRQGEVAQILQKAAVQIDSADMNRLLLMGDKASLQKGIELLAPKGTDGAGAPALVGADRRRLRNQFQAALKEFDENDRAGKQLLIRNHHDKTLNGNLSRDPDLLEKMRDAGEFDDNPEINERMYQTEKWKQRYNETLHEVIFGSTNSKLDKSYEPDQPLMYKSAVALNKISKELDPTNWVNSNKPKFGDPNAVDLADLRVSHNRLISRVSSIQNGRQMDRAAQASDRFLTTQAGRNVQPPSTRQQSRQAEQYPELWSRQVFNSERIKYVKDEQRRVNPLVTPEYFSKNEIDTIKEAFSRSSESGQARADLIQMIDDQAGPDAPDVFAELDRKGIIKAENQLYLDFVDSPTVLENLHTALTASNATLYQRFQERDQRIVFDQEFDTNTEVGKFSASFSIDPGTQSRMSEAVRKYALTIYNADPSREMTETEAIEQAVKDLIGSKYIVAPGGFGGAHYLQEKSKTNVLLHDQPMIITEGLKSLTSKVAMLDPSQRAHDSDHTFFVSTGEGATLFMMSEGKATPALKKDGRSLVQFTNRDINLAGLQVLLAKEQAAKLSAEKRPRGFTSGKVEKYDMTMINLLEEQIALYQ